MLIISGPPAADLPYGWSGWFAVDSLTVVNGSTRTLRMSGGGARDAERVRHDPDARRRLRFARHDSRQRQTVACGDPLHGCWRYQASHARPGPATRRRRLPRPAAGSLLSIRTVRTQGGVCGRLPRHSRPADGYTQNRLGEIDEITPIIAFLKGPGSGWVTAQTLFVNGGFIAR